MRKVHYKRERGKLEEKQVVLQAELDHIRRKIEALDVVWNEIFNGSDADQSENTAIEFLKTAPDAESSGQRNGKPEDLAAPPAAVINGKVGQAIEAAVRQISGDFGVIEVAQLVNLYLEELPERATIAGKLKKLADDGKLELVVQGRGRRPSSYRRIA
jgi:hypothetical protein